MTEYNLVDDNCTSFQYSFRSLKYMHDAYKILTSAGWYDISNIQGFTIGQEIQAQGGETVSCQSASCDCTQAYAQGST